MKKEYLVLSTQLGTVVLTENTPEVKSLSVIAESLGYTVEGFSYGEEPRYRLCNVTAYREVDSDKEGLRLVMRVDLDKTKVIYS
jgi:hypothetical protein